MKRQFLYRLIGILIVVLIIPTMVFMWLVSSLHNDQLTNDSEQYYQNAVDNYSALLDKRITDLRFVAASLAAKSKKAESAFYNGTDAISKDPYLLYLAASELTNRYSAENVAGWGVYFYDTGRIIAPGSAYHYDRYVNSIVADNGNSEAVAEFFSERNYNYLSVNACSCVDVGTNEKQMLLGVCTTIGKYKDRVMVFFEMKPEHIAETLIIADNEGFAYYLLGADNQMLLQWGMRSDEYLDTVLKGDQYREYNGIKQKVSFSSKSDLARISITTYITEDSVQSQMIEQVHRSRNVLYWGMALVLVLCILVIWLTYKPIYALMKDLDYSEGTELDAIRTILNDRHIQITEYEMMVMDLLMDHLLHGVPVSETRLRDMGIPASYDHYCVVMLKDYVPTKTESEDITKSIAMATNARCFVTDWKDGEYTIFIVFMPNDCKDNVMKVLTGWMAIVGIEENRLFDGKIVDQLNLIQNSFRSCLTKIKRYETTCDLGEEQTEESTAEKHIRLKNEVLLFVDQHFNEQDLSQTKVADSFGISTYTLSRLFKNEIGVGFAEYLIAKRIAHATELLLSSEHSISEISTLSGFSGINHFSKTFKMYKGCAPSQFRKQE